MKGNSDIGGIMEDIWRMHPGKLVLSKKELAGLRNVSESTINREIRDGLGVEYIKTRGRVTFPIRSIAEWLSRTVKTI